jgi:hypothetical protein
MGLPGSPGLAGWVPAAWVAGWGTGGGRTSGGAPRWPLAGGWAAGSALSLADLGLGRCCGRRSAGRGGGLVVVGGWEPGSLCCVPVRS